MDIFKVEYLLLVKPTASCRTTASLNHLLQSDSDISIKNQDELTFKNTLSVDYIVSQGTTSQELDDQESLVFFNIELTCKSIKDLELFNDLLRSIKQSTRPLLAATSGAMQTLWDDPSIYYSGIAYPLISNTENLMRKLITKFMHINIGQSWTKDRIPDDVQNTVNKNNNDETFLYNVDFARLKDILLSENYSKDRDTLMSRIKERGQDSVNIEEIKALIPISNWEKYFASRVSCDAAELEKLWDGLYVLRCKVAHNKTFSKQDLNDVKRICSKLDAILLKALTGLDKIKVDKKDAQEVADNIVIDASGADSHKPHIMKFLFAMRELETATFEIASRLYPEQKWHDRSFMRDTRALVAADIITSQDLHRLKVFHFMKNQLNHMGDLKGLGQNDWDINIPYILELTSMLKRQLSQKIRENK